ncbi:MAG TPA: ABC transporter permease [Terrimicrobium sp.]
MYVYLFQRVVTAFLTLFGMSVVIFVLLRLVPGNIVDILFASAGFVNPAAKQEIARELGLDQPIPVQYGRWLRDIVRGELGKSYRYDIPAWQVIKPRIPVTLELAILALLIAVLLGVPVGVLSAIRQDTVTDYLLRT